MSKTNFKNRTLDAIGEIGPHVFEGILELLEDGVYVVDRDRRITYWSAGAERLTGFSAAEVIGCHCADTVLAHVDERGTNLCAGDCPLHCSIDTGEVGESLVFMHHRDGHRVPVMVRTMPLHDDQGEIIGAVEVFSDQTPQATFREREAELEKLVLLDELTRVGNRRAGLEALDRRLAEMERYGWSFGLLFIDLDRFKELNDRYGHAAGDEALHMVAATLAHNVRAFDEISRWGGEEFLVICPRIDAALLVSLAERLKALVATAAVVGEDRVLRSTISVGATLAQPGDTPESLVARADKLMYAAKASGRDRVVFG
jgi:diguanylate cyclase (GGDEF)-like protein/PAS domain S-box-containing protein